MPTKAEFDALRDALISSADEIAADLTKILEQLQNGGLDATEEAAVFADMEALVTRLRGIADVVPPTP